MVPLCGGVGGNGATRFFCIIISAGGGACRYCTDGVFSDRPDAATMVSAFSGSGFERCPITHEVFRDPVVASDGHTYEREAIESWIFIDNIGSSACCRRRRRLSPMTGLPLETYVLLPNHALKKAIEERSQRLFGAKQSKHILASICVFLVSVLCVSYMLAAAAAQCPSRLWACTTRSSD